MIDNVGRDNGDAQNLPDAQRVHRQWPDSGVTVPGIADTEHKVCDIDVAAEN
jgi:hypothetical protein